MFHLQETLWLQKQHEVPHEAARRHQTLPVPDLYGQIHQVFLVLVVI
jgi:hypothetical protein